MIGGWGRDPTVEMIRFPMPLEITAGDVINGFGEPPPGRADVIQIRLCTTTIARTASTAHNWSTMSRVRCGGDEGHPAALTVFHLSVWREW